MFEIAIAVFLGLVLFAAFGAQTASGLQLAASIGLRVMWRPLGRLMRWTGRAIAVATIPLAIALSRLDTPPSDDMSAMSTGAIIGGVIGFVIAGVLELAGQAFAKVDRLVRGEAPARTPAPASRAAPPGVRVSLVCGNCSVSNGQGSAFCKGCGHRLKVIAGPGMFLICIECATQNEHDAAFCKKCGTALSAAG